MQKHCQGGKIFLLEPSQFLLQCRTVCSPEEMSQFSEQKNIAINWHRQKLQKRLPMIIPQSRELSFLKNEVLGRNIQFWVPWALGKCNWLFRVVTTSKWVLFLSSSSHQHFNVLNGDVVEPSPCPLSQSQAAIVACSACILFDFPTKWWEASSARQYKYFLTALCKSESCVHPPKKIFIAA